MTLKALRGCAQRLRVGLGGNRIDERLDDEP
jgi:hypothetical protein